MKTIGPKCGWVISGKERRVLKLLRAHTRECDYDFVTNSPGSPRHKPAVKLPVEFAEEELSAFSAPILVKPEALAA